MKCSECGLENEPEYIFCTDCGATLTPAPVHKPENLTWTFSPRKRAETLLRRVIEGKYRLESILGIGGMGTVFCATRLKLGDQVAVKILHPELMQDDEAARRFYREAQMAAQVKHPNAINIFDVGVTEDGLQFIVMEFFKGDSLREVIKQQSPLELSFVAAVVGQVCGALDEAHRQGITHRDIKPDNVLVAPISGKLHVKVLDFGIAKLLDKTASSLTLTGNILGTPQYMSPEQCMGDELDGRADIYSVGIMIYEMLAGTVPFQAVNSNAVALQQVQQPPPPLAGLPNVSPKIEQVVMRALAKKPDDRQPTAGTLGYELDLAVSEFLGIKTPHTPITLESVAFNRQHDSYTPRPEPAPATPATGSQTANEPTLLFRKDDRLSRSKPVVTPTKVSVPTAAEQSSLKKILAALGVLLLVGAVGGFLLFADSSENGSGAAPGPSPKSSAKSSQPTPPAGMAYVPGGTFTMGGDKYLFQDKMFESPPHEATVSPFFMDIYEVTRDEYKKFMNATNYPAPKIWLGGEVPPGTGRLPVTDVNWDAANAYAKWAGKRLPTEAEWEFAARGTDRRLFPWGNDWKAGMANADNVRKGMVEVGLYKGASPYGLYDMVGNAWEWTATNLEPYPGGTMPEVKTGVDLKIIRGGTWLNDRTIANATRRGFYGAREEETYSNTGFRCVKDIAEK